MISLITEYPIIDLLPLSLPTPTNHSQFSDYLEKAVQKLLGICDTLGVDCIVDLTLQVTPRYPHEVSTIIWHLLTNAVAHRSVNVGVITIRLIDDNPCFNTLVVEDNFGGIDKDMIASQVGYVPTDTCLTEIIQEKGFTTRLNTDDGISGRGHGLAQVREWCIKIGSSQPVYEILEAGFRATISNI